MTRSFDPAVIPHGSYCYASLSPMDERGIMKVNGLCPYWERRGEDNAYCRYLDEEDAVLLWDQCKICDVNCDSNSDPQGENSRSEVEGEASQSGGAEGAASPNPSINQETPHAR